MGQRRGHTELFDLQKEPPAPVARLGFERDAGLFGRGDAWYQRFEKKRQVVRLVPDELFHPPVPADVAVRLGKLRVSEILINGREVTRAVLQAGAVFRTRPVNGAPAAPPATGGDTEPAADDPAPLGENLLAEPYDLGHIILMALGEAEVWVLPAGSVPPSPGS